MTIAVFLAALLGATPAVDGTAVSATGGNLLVSLTIGNHSSLLIPNSSTAPAATNGEMLATGEFQQEVVSFIASGGLGGAYTTP